MTPSSVSNSAEQKARRAKTEAFIILVKKGVRFEAQFWAGKTFNNFDSYDRTLIRAKLGFNIASGV